MAILVQKNVQKCNHSLHAQESAALKHMARRFNNAFCMHMCNRTSHVCVRARTDLHNSPFDILTYIKEKKCPTYRFIIDLRPETALNGVSQLEL